MMYEFYFTRQDFYPAAAFVQANIDVMVIATSEDFARTRAHTISTSPPNGHTWRFILNSIVQLEDK